jgi:hypothetical protein
MQALGRARGINRTDETPLDIDLLFDTCIPVTVNEVVLWEPPSLMIETAAEGVMLTSPGDMVKLWPKLWTNEKAAYRRTRRRATATRLYTRELPPGRRENEAEDCSFQSGSDRRPDVVATGKAWESHCGVALRKMSE